jgi:adenosine deaminase
MNDTSRRGGLDLATIRAAPKVLLHDHLDGGLRPRTVVELARDGGYGGLPTTDPDELSAWFRRGADRKSLELYLAGFAHTVGVMQTPEALERVAAECAEDFADDGIVYAEVRFAPELHLEQGMTLDEVVEAVLRGFRRGSEGRPLEMRALVTAMRTAARSLEIAELAVRHRDAGVVGFDIAGAEKGYPPSRHLDAFHYIAHENFHFTIHAGEASGSRWGGWRPTSATGGSRWRCARPRTSTPAPSPRSRSTRSTSCVAFASGSR